MAGTLPEEAAVAQTFHRSLVGRLGLVLVQGAFAAQVVVAEYGAGGLLGLADDPVDEPARGGAGDAFRHGGVTPQMTFRGTPTSCPVLAAASSRQPDRHPAAVTRVTPPRRRRTKDFVRSSPPSL